MCIESCKLCQQIGIETFGELRRFLKEERQEGESIVNCLMRYYLSIGGSAFKIVHA